MDGLYSALRFNSLMVGAILITARPMTQKGKWEQAVDCFGTLIQDVSTGWQERRCTPSAQAQDVRQLFTESLPRNGQSFDTLIAKLRTVGEYSGYNGHPRWLAYITSSPDPVGVMASFFTAAINQNNNLWRITPAATSIELQCLNWFKEMFGLSPEWEGTFASGGQFANIIACAAARTAQCPWDVRKYGVAGPTGSDRMRIYTSDQAHYCHHQAVELLGLGSEALQVVPTDEQYRMNFDQLVKMVARDRKEGHLPIAVIATAGTVGTGSIDPLAELRTWTQQEKLWLHIDLAHYMAQRIKATPTLELMTEPGLSVVCWRVVPPRLKDHPEALNDLQLKIIDVLESRGIALLSKAKLQGGLLTLRACFVNFRTTMADVDATVEATRTIGDEFTCSAETGLDMETMS